MSEINCKHTHCDRCGESISEHWSDGWPLFGWIKIGYGGQVSNFVNNGMRDNPQHAADDEARAFWNKAASGDISWITSCEAQSMTIQWGENERYRLCRRCQKVILAFFGMFFGESEAKVLKLQLEAQQSAGENSAAVEPSEARIIASRANKHGGDR